MTSVTRSRARSALVSAAGVVLLLGAAGCTGDDTEDSGSPSSTASRGEDAPEVTTVLTLQNVGKSLDGNHRQKVKDGVLAAIDPWFEGAFLGDFPRADFAAAFSGFSDGAAADAQGRDLDLLTNQAIGGQIDSATAVNRRVRVDVFAHDGHPRGATAHFVLDFETEGELQELRRVHGDLYIAKDKGEWKIFGYKVDEAVAL